MSSEKVALSVKLQTILTEISFFNYENQVPTKLTKEDIYIEIAQASSALEIIKDATGRIIDEYNSHAFNNTGSLFSISGVVVLSEGQGLNDPKLKLKVVLGFILGGMLAVFWVWGRRLVS